MQIHWLYEHSEHWIGFTILYPCSAFHLDTDWTTRQVQPTSCGLLLLPLSKALNRKKQRKMFIAFLKQNFKRDILSCISLRFLKSVNYNSKEGAWGFTLTGWADGAARCYYTGGAVKTKPVSPCGCRQVQVHPNPNPNGSRGLVHIRNPTSPSRASSERRSSRPCDRPPEAVALRGKPTLPWKPAFSLWLPHCSRFSLQPAVTTGWNRLHFVVPRHSAVKRRLMMWWDAHLKPPFQNAGWELNHLRPRTHNRCGYS